MSPYCASRRTIGTFRLVANQLSTRRDCAVTSGPMPSPPTTATLIMLDRLFMPISLQNISMAARRDQPPERRGFRRRAVASLRLHRDRQAILRGGADQSRNGAAVLLAR